MSSGPGKAERFVIAQVLGESQEWRSSDGRWHGTRGNKGLLEPGFGVTLVHLAEIYAKLGGIPYTRDVVETVRRAVKRLERKGRVITDHVWLPDRENGRQRRRMLVGRPQEALLRADYWSCPRQAGPDRFADRPSLLKDGCQSCGAEAGEAEIAALEVEHGRLSIKNMCLTCWLDKREDPPDDAQMLFGDWAGWIALDDYDEVIRLFTGRRLEDRDWAAEAEEILTSFHADDETEEECLNRHVGYGSWRGFAADGIP